MRFFAVALVVAAGVMPAAAVLADPCPPGSVWIPAGYGKKAKWVTAHCIPAAGQVTPPYRSATGAERSTTTQLNRNELSRVQAR